MRILLTNLSLRGRTGTEVVVRDICLNLHRRGHEVTVFAKRLGAPASELRAVGVQVVDDLDDVASPPDVIHGHHNIPMVAALGRFPMAASVWMSHDTRNWFDPPPLFPSIFRYVAVDQLRYDYLTQQFGIEAERVMILPNAVDLARIPPRANALPPVARSVLAFTKTKGELDLLARCCRVNGLSFTALGRGAGRTTATPEKELVVADIVFASGRSAIEALCAGACVIVGDARGMAGLVTLDNYEHLRRRNFGRGAFTEPFSEAAVHRELARYNAAEALAITQLTRRLASVDDLIVELEALYEQAKAAPMRFDPVRDQEALRAFLGSWPAPRFGSRWRWRRERRALSEWIA